MRKMKVFSVSRKLLLFPEYFDLSFSAKNRSNVELILYRAICHSGSVTSNNIAHLDDHLFRKYEKEKRQKIIKTELAE